MDDRMSASTVSMTDGSAALDVQRDRSRKLVDHPVIPMTMGIDE